MAYITRSVAYYVCSGAAGAVRKISSSLWAGLKAHCQAYYHGTLSQIPFLCDVAVNLRHVFSPTPEEYAQRLRVRCKRWSTRLVPIMTSDGVIYEPYFDLPPVATGNIRVKLYRDLDRLYQDSNLFVDVPLGPSGELDLRIVRQTWSLQNCYAVDSARLELFEPATEHPEILSAMAVQILTDDQFWLRVVEQPSAGRIAARSIRRAVQRGQYTIRRSLHSTRDSPFIASVTGYSSALLFIGACFVATRYLDQFNEWLDLCLNDAHRVLCRSVETMLCEATAVVNVYECNVCVC